jgi:phosphate starvation-inducible PhoH-like protein
VIGFGNGRTAATPDRRPTRTKPLETRIPLLTLEEEQQLFGPHDRHAKEVSRRFHVRITSRGGHLRLVGPEDQVTALAQRVESLLQRMRAGQHLTNAALQAGLMGESDQPANGEVHQGNFGEAMKTRSRMPRARTDTQRAYLEMLASQDVIFAIGPAGTGKTFLAVAAALQAMQDGRVRRIVLTRPAVEAGEKLGFLPGDLEEKVDPYLRPLYDALNDLSSPAAVRRMRDLDMIEIAPLAFMRGRTLNDSFVILDEAQNATPGQMKMFLTRMGEGTRAVVTGDHTQSDLPGNRAGGLEDAIRRLRGIEGVGIAEFQPADVQRSHIVQRIVEAYGDA